MIFCNTVYYFAPSERTVKIGYKPPPVEASALEREPPKIFQSRIPVHFDAFCFVLIKTHCKVVGNFESLSVIAWAAEEYARPS